MIAGIELLSTIVVVFFLMIAFLYMMCKSVKKASTIIINVLLGGALFLILNILGMGLAIDIINMGIITVFGVPGVILIVILKFLGV